METVSSRPFLDRVRCGFAGVVFTLLTAVLCGCQDVSFYQQAVKREGQVLARQHPIQSLIADPKTPAALKAKFETVLKIHDFAVKHLDLPNGQSYLRYVDLHQEYAVWNVNVAPALSLEPKTWWFPVVGRASYHGFFSEEPARRYAAKFAKNGSDVYVAGIETYSTLGWFEDPLLNTFVNEPDTYLTEVIFHELAHQRLFVAGDTDFNEAFATTVANEGVRRWLLSASQPETYERYRADQREDHQFIDLIMATRGELQAVYSDPKLSNAVKLTRKQDIIARLRAKHDQLKASWGGKSPYQGWFDEPINNAKLNTVSAYYDLVPAFEALLRANGDDLRRFYEAAAQLGKLPLDERHEKLRAYLPATPK